MTLAIGYAALALNVVWFGLGFRLFSLRPRQAARLLVPIEHREEASRQALVAALPFLGGMNLAWAVLSAAALAVSARAGAPASWIVFAASGLAHATQFAGNVPVAKAGGPWPVLRGPMRFIFTVDAIAAVANTIALVAVASR